MYFFCPKANFLYFWGYLSKILNIFEKSPKSPKFAKITKIAKNHKNAQIHDFLVPTLLRFKDSETIWKKCTLLPQSQFSVFLRVLKQNSEYFPKIAKIAKIRKNHQNRKKSQKCPNPWFSSTHPTTFQGLRDNLEKMHFVAPKPIFCIFEGT